MGAYLLIVSEKEWKVELRGQEWDWLCGVQVPAESGAGVIVDRYPWIHV